MFITLVWTIGWTRRLVTLWHIALESSGKCILHSHHMGGLAVMAVELGMSQNHIRSSGAETSQATSNGFLLPNPPVLLDKQCVVWKSIFLMFLEHSIHMILLWTQIVSLNSIILFSKDATLGYILVTGMQILRLLIVTVDFISFWVLTTRLYVWPLFQDVTEGFVLLRGEKPQANCSRLDISKIS